MKKEDGYVERVRSDFYRLKIDELFDDVLDMTEGE